MIMNTSEPTGSLRVVLCFTFKKDAIPSEIKALKQHLLNRPCVSHAIELSGAFDLIIEATLDNFQCYNDLLSNIDDSIKQYVTRLETNFISRRHSRGRNEPDRRCLWVPHDNSHIRVDYSMIDKIIAESDYMRLHCGQKSWLIHATMHSIIDTLGTEFIALNRSILVRIDFIERLIHHCSGWQAKLGDNSIYKVARSQTRNVLGMIRGHSPNKNDHSPQIIQPAENLVLANIED